ncbi:uncharacterized protein [Diadema antillarum]|uniref:uncharacterized protein n=1 Tax=Diadema antillarum TaxID=105358 RepID=UPI003A8AC8C2
MILTTVHCEGVEANLSTCQHTRQVDAQCPGSDVAGVKCSPPIKKDQPVAMKRGGGGGSRGGSSGGGGSRGGGSRGGSSRSGSSRSGSSRSGSSRGRSSGKSSVSRRRTYSGDLDYDYGDGGGGGGRSRLAAWQIILIVLGVIGLLVMAMSACCTVFTTNGTVRQTEGEITYQNGNNIELKDNTTSSATPLKADVEF